MHSSPEGAFLVCCERAVLWTWVHLISRGALQGGCLVVPPNEPPLSKRVGRLNSLVFFLPSKKIITLQNSWSIHMVQKSKHYKNVCIENFDSHPCEIHFTPPSLIPVRRAEHILQFAHSRPTLCSSCQWMISNTHFHSQKCLSLGDKWFLPLPIVNHFY